MGDEKVSSRDAGELVECFRAHARDLFGYACVLTRGDVAQAEDLVQGGFEAAARQWHAVRCLTESQRRNWLRATVASLAVSGLRRDTAFSIRRPRIEISIGKRAAGTPAHPFPAMVLQRCWQIIACLPERQHSVAVLRWHLDLKEHQIAALLGMADKTVSTHLHLVRRTLIAQLGPGCPCAIDAPGGMS